MSTTPPDPAAVSSRSPWARVVLVLGVLAILASAGVWIWTAKKVTEAPAAVVEKTVELARVAGEQAQHIARAFHIGTVRQEFFSQAAEISGGHQVKIATLKQRETFQRENSDKIAWGLLAVPKTVVQAQAPVEYPYFVDLKEAWEFRQQDKVVIVIAPVPAPGTPAMDVSALRFYTLEGGIWRDEERTREELRSTFTAELEKRARDNLPLVRELGRRQITELVSKWLSGRFGDGSEYFVKVLFADEAPPPESLRPKD